MAGGWLTFALVTSQIMNWTGHVVAAPRSELAALPKRQEASAQDQGGKDFWDRAIVLTSKDANLTKAHARYLESRFITLAWQARRARLLNGTSPAPLRLPEADESDMEYFVAQAKIILPVLGVNILRSAAADADGAAEVSALARVSSPVFALHLKKDGITARARGPTWR